MGFIAQKAVQGEKGTEPPGASRASAATAIGRAATVAHPADTSMAAAGAASTGSVNSLFERMPMIARHWRGWTETRNADAYETLLETKVLPELRQVAGYRGGYILRSDGAEEVEFVVINLFESIDAVRLFAGPDYSIPVFEPEARLLLSRIEPIASHYEVRASTI
ncbi:MAG TPA: hypothetical protein VHU44_03200 [Acidobacteriaceae bacterium]|nr:hypothetical protein [Acidobacteriaceae bacterium]